MRDRTTWATFGALFAFGFMNAVLGPALPYLRAAEGVSYLVGALHQAAYAVGGGVAGLLAVRGRGAGGAGAGGAGAGGAGAGGGSAGRGRTIVLGLLGAGAAGLALGYGTTPVVTIPAALAMSLSATAALIRLWAVLADLHGARRAVAMSEGEVAVSLAGIVTPLLIGALAATALGWRFAFVLGAGAAVLAIGTVRIARLPPPVAAGGDDVQAAGGERGRGGWGRPTLVLIFLIVALEWTLSFWLASYLDDDIGLARDTAVAAVGGLYAAFLAGRVAASRLARRFGPRRLVGVALITVVVGLPPLLLAGSALAAAAGIAIAGAGIGATFPLASALHIHTSPLSADAALGQVLTIAAPGQLTGPLVAGAIAQAAGLRAGLLVLPVCAVLGGVAVWRVRE